MPNILQQLSDPFANGIFTWDSSTKATMQSINDYFANGIFDWNIYTTILCIIISAYFVYPAFFSPEPDIHPLLLARQSAPSRVRQPGESAVYRSLDAPHSYPLKTGLNVKDPGQPKWTAGRDGDLRDIWKRAVGGPVDKDGKPTGEGAAKVSVVLGKEGVIDYDFVKLTTEVNAIGKHLQKDGTERVAIYLANTVELLVTLFACAFYGLTPVLIPQEQPLEALATILNETKTDTLIVGAGAIPLTELGQLYAGLKEVVWVVARSSRHMDWHEVPEGEGGKAAIGVWHEIIDEATASSELPDKIPNERAPDVLIATEDGNNGHEIVEFSQANIAAAVSAQIAVLPRSYSSTQVHHLQPSDTVISLAPLTDIYPLTIVLAALFANTSLALTSVTGPQATFAFASLGISPTIVIALPQTLAKFCSEDEAAPTGTFAKYVHGRRLETLRNGSMPKIRTTLSNIRLIYTYDRTNSQQATLTASQLDSVRLLNDARTIYGLSTPKVAGAICQTNMLDYQSNGLRPDAPTHLGSPLSCVEVKLTAHSGEEIDDNKPTGKLLVSGPAVVGGETELDQAFTITDNSTIAYES